MKRVLLLAALGALVATSTAGASPRKVEVQGKITALSTTSITVQPRTRTAVTCTIPATRRITGFATGNRVEMKCRASGAALVLQRLKHEDDEVEVKGRITALGSTSITVQPRTGAPVTCTITARTTLAGFRTGNQVEMECQQAGSTLVLRRLKHEDDEDRDDDGDRRGGDRGGDDRGEGHGGRGRH